MTTQLPIDWTKEEWRTVSDNVKYEVSSFGRIRKREYIVRRKNKWFLRGGNVLVLSTNGIYVKTTFGKRDQRLVHRIVAKEFIPNPNNYPQVNHIDFDPTNNFIKNLEWVTGYQNSQHSSKAGRLKAFVGVGEKNPRCKLSADKVLEIRDRSKTESASILAVEYGVTFSHIRNIFYRRIWKHL